MAAAGVFFLAPAGAGAGDAGVNVSIRQHVRGSGETHVRSSSKINIDADGETVDANVSIDGENIEIHQDEFGREVRQEGKVIQKDDGTEPIVIKKQSAEEQEFSLESGEAAPEAKAEEELPEPSPWFMLLLQWLSVVIR